MSTPATIAEPTLRNDGRTWIERDEVLTAAKFVNAAAARRSTIPILASILVEAVNGSLTLAATNLDITLREVVRADDLAGEMHLCVHGDTFIRALSVLDAGPITLHVDSDMRLVVSQGGASIAIDSTHAEDYPTIAPVPASGGCEIQGDVLTRLIAHTQFATTREETRFQLNGAIFRVRQRSLEMVATNGHHVTISRVAGEFQNVEVEDALISSAACDEVPRLGHGPIRYGRIDPANLYFASTARSVSVRSVEISFPNYYEVIPTDNTIVATIRTAELRRAIAQVRVMTNPRSSMCRFNFDRAGVELFAFYPDQGTATAIVPLVTYVGEPVTINLSLTYLGQFIDAVADSETVTFRLKDRNSALVAEPSGSDTTYCLMPMRAA